jgi:hypothetical protein
LDKNLISFEPLFKAEELKYCVLAENLKPSIYTFSDK